MHSAQGELCLHVTAGNDCSVHGAEVQDLYEVAELFSLRIDKKVFDYIYTGSLLLRSQLFSFQPKHVWFNPTNSSLMSLWTKSKHLFQTKAVHCTFLWCSCCARWSFLLSLWTISYSGVWQFKWNLANSPFRCVHTPICFYKDWKLYPIVHNRINEISVSILFLVFSKWEFDIFLRIHLLYPQNIQKRNVN